jgi:AraC family transcriptional regulator
MMSVQRIEELFDGCKRPVCEAPPLLTSAGTSWAGFLLERDFCRAGSAKTVWYPYTSLILVASGSVHVENHAYSQDKHSGAGVKTVTVWPAGFEARNASWTPRDGGGPPVEMIRLQVDVSVLNRLVTDGGSHTLRRIEPRFALDDPTLATWRQLNETEIIAGCPAGPLFAESVCLALLSRVHLCCAANPTEAVPQARTLSRRQYDLVKEFINANLSSALTLTQLASLVGLSPGHFLAVFKATAGTTPHRYVTDQRIATAKSLLRDGGHPIADIATALGFASQSHFTEAFRRVAGTTPLRFRREA